ncbi:MAG: addiction module killer protein [Spirochaetaceae bacterium]|nr:addiction module killer protein [Spirochaetaceae bacterium]
MQKIHKCNRLLGFRVYFARRGQEIVILLCGGDKSTQSGDIEAAKQIAQNLEGV